MINWCSLCYCIVSFDSRFTYQVVVHVVCCMLYVGIGFFVRVMICAVVSVTVLLPLILSLHIK